MGQKVNPIGLRLGYIYDWDSRWVAIPDPSKKLSWQGKYRKQLLEDIRIREYIKSRLRRGALSKIVIERTGQRLRILIHTARPGIVIGRGGAEIERLRQEVQQMTDMQIQIDIVDIEEPELDAQLLSEAAARQIERKVAFRRAMKRTVALAMRYGAAGVKVACSGRLAGVEIARCEWYREGRIPLSTFRAKIDYGFSEAMTKYGKIGVKVWIFKEEKPHLEDATTAQNQV